MDFILGFYRKFWVFLSQPMSCVTTLPVLWLAKENLQRPSTDYSKQRVSAGLLCGSKLRNEPPLKWICLLTALCRASLAEDSVSSVAFFQFESVVCQIIFHCWKNNSTFVTFLHNRSWPFTIFCVSFSFSLTLSLFVLFAGHNGGGHWCGTGCHPFSDGVHYAATRPGGRSSAALQPGH